MTPIPRRPAPQARFAPGLALGLALLGGLALSTGAPARAQQPAPPAPLVRPGDGAVDGSRLRPGTSTLRVVLSRDGQQVPLGRLTEELIATRVDGRAAYLRVQTMRSPMAGTVVDSAWLDRRTLAPLRRHSLDVGGETRLRFQGPAVQGSVHPPGDTARVLSQRFEAPVFDANPLDLVIRALPLTRGYRARLPAYDPSLGGRIVVAVRVVGSERVEVDGRQVDAWVVEATRDDRAARFWIERDGRAVLGQRTEPGPGIQVIMTR